ncbi:MAG: serine/threonine-protein kinase, partial [Polyangiaceae bacterium]
AGQVKVVDFGIAKAALSSQETEVGVLKGKVAYMSPEQAMAGPIDQRADIFAMGIVLWELLTRQRLMTGDSAASTLNRLLNAPIPSVSTLREDVDPELDAIVGRALEKDPQYRFQTAQEMRDALDTFIRATGDKFRQDEVGRRMTSMFAKVREEVQRQIQAHMATVAVATDEAALNADGTKSRGMATSGGSLLQLNVSGGSGSGVIPAFQPGHSQSSVMASSMSAAGSNLRVAPAEKNNNKMLVVLITVMMGLLGCAVVALLLMGLKKKPADDNVGITGSASSGVAAGGSVAGGGSAAVGPSSVPAAVTGVVANTPPGVGVQVDPISAHPKNPVGGKHPGTPPTTKSATPPVAPAGDDGHLTLDTYPFTKVSENGKVLGTTPIINVALPPGTHNLMLENADQGIKQSFTVTIKSGETVTKKLGLK